MFEIQIENEIVPKKEEFNWNLIFPKKWNRPFSSLKN